MVVVGVVVVVVGAAVVVGRLAVVNTLDVMLDPLVGDTEVEGAEAEVVGVDEPRSGGNSGGESAAESVVVVGRTDVLVPRSCSSLSFAAISPTANDRALMRLSSSAPAVETTPSSSWLRNAKNEAALIKAPNTNANGTRR